MLNRVFRERTKLILLFLLSIFLTPASAANFSASCPTRAQPNVGCWILLRGSIVRGDADRLLTTLRNQPRGSDIYRYLLLDSPGGDVAEALKLIKVVRDALLQTQNYAPFRLAGDPAYTCASSCVLVLMAGVQRNFAPFNGGRLGLHRPSFSVDTYSGKSLASDLAERQHQVMRYVREFLLSEGMPQLLVEEMMNRSSKEIYWIDFAKDWLEVRPRAAWFDEMLISRCNFDPTAEARAVKAAVEGNKAAESMANADVLRSAPCARSLIRDAQARLRE